MSDTKRLRIFAGPNGSGKTTVFRRVAESYRTGPFVNADEMARSFRERGFVALRSYGLRLQKGEWNRWVRGSAWMSQLKAAGKIQPMRISGDRIHLRMDRPVSYEAALTSAFVRQALLNRGTTFSIETVMSHPSKVELMREAASLGYRTYLYFICTEDPELNVARVQQRVAQGEHDVPARKIRDRYKRSLGLLHSAIMANYRTFLFDNSGKEYTLLLEFKEGKEMTLRQELVPAWALDFAVKPLFPDIVD